MSAWIIRALTVVTAAVATLPSGSALAQAWPQKPVRLIVPVTTGGPSDLVARLLADKLAASLGKPVIVENRPGASQTVGAHAVAKAEPDGHTLLQAAANMAINPILMSDLPFDTMKDFAPVSLTHLTPYVFVVSSQSGAKSLEELLRALREAPAKATYGTTGQGSPQQLATLLLAQMASGLAGMTEVQYKGSSAAHPDLISNRITFMIDPLAASAPHIKAGTLRALAVSTPQRYPAFADVPTAAEKAVPGYDFASWGGIFAPAGLPAEVMKRLNGDIAAALASPDLKKRMDDMGLIARPSSPEEFRAFVQSEMARWGALLKKKP